MKILIVDGSEAFCVALREMLGNFFETEFYCDGAGAVNKIRTYRPDILILSAILPGNDGFHILRTVKSAGDAPEVLMLTSLVSEYVLELAAELKVSYMMCKPCNLRAILSCVHSMADRLNGNRHREDLSQAAGKILLQLGFRSNLCGYRYLLAALESLSREPAQSLTKVIYPAAARACNCSWQQIERGIRTAITDAYRNGEEEVWNLYFPPVKDGARHKPTNSMFLSRMCERLAQKDRD